jgi:hypothetical protein
MGKRKRAKENCPSGTAMESVRRFNSGKIGMKEVKTV